MRLLIISVCDNSHGCFGRFSNDALHLFRNTLLRFLDCLCCALGGLGNLRLDDFRGFDAGDAYELGLEDWMGLLAICLITRPTTNTHSR